jgi:hypothetical protein
MSYASRVYRQRNAHSHEETKNESFFKKQYDVNNNHTKNGFFQAKLSVNQPGDSYEKEADAVASSVVNRSSRAPVVQQKKISNIQRLSTSKEDEKLGTNEARMLKDKEIQRQPMQAGEDMEKEKLKGVQKKEDPLKEDEEVKSSNPVQRKAEASSSVASTAISKQIESGAGKGSPLSKNALHEMNSSFGVDFSDVRIHKDASAADMSKELQAQAFTYGRDIYFDEGKYNPESRDGKLLLAHELTHVLQQNENIHQKSIQRNLLSSPTTANPAFVFELDVVTNTFSDLGSMFGVSIPQIQAANPSLSPSRLRTGTQVRIPAREYPAAVARPTGPPSPSIVQSTGTALIDVRWNAGGPTGGNLLGKIKRGKPVGDIGGGFLVRIADLHNVSPGILSEMRTLNIADATEAFAFIPAGNVRSLLTPVSSTDIDLMARMIWGEQRSQGRDAMVAAAWIARNRFDAGWGSYSQIINVAQFHGIATTAQVTGLTGSNLTTWTQAQQVAQEVTDGTIPDPTGGFLFFGNRAGVLRSMQACARTNTAFSFRTISGTNLHISNGDFTGTCAVP